MLYSVNYVLFLFGKDIVFKVFRWLIYIIYVVLIASVSAEHEALVILQDRLKKINNFYGYVVQTISNSDNDELIKNEGELWIKRPNLLYWHVVTPEENFLIADGETLWFYVPTIKQVTAYHLQDFSDNIFFALFSNNDLFPWDDYVVLYCGDDFIITPVSHDVSFKEVKIKITDNGVINRIIFVEENGQYTEYCLYRQNNNVIDINKFSFVLSKDIQLDDQRK